MFKVIVYKAQGQHFALRTNGNGALAKAMGTVVFTTEHEDIGAAVTLARLEAEKKGLKVQNL